MPKPAGAKTVWGLKSSHRSWSKFSIPSISLIVIAGLIFGLIYKNSGGACGTYRDDKTLIINGQAIQTEVAATPAARQQGLSGRPCILANQAMLFEFNQPGYYSFWMKDMRFPIDMVWLGASKKVAWLQSDVQPATYPANFTNRNKAAQYVLELKANRAQQLHLAIGSPVQF